MNRDIQIIKWDVIIIVIYLTKIYNILLDQARNQFLKFDWFESKLDF